MPHLGIVIIGRNEGERLRRCLASVLAEARPVVYVDSGSTDGSVEHARSVGAEVVELDPALPFSAARARNEGFARLIAADPEIAYVQFVDGDVEIAAGWIQRAARELEARADVAAVCGRLRERFPEASIYNRLCDAEWNAPPGEVPACGGIAMYRSRAFQAAGGFNPEIVAGEEPELCFRLRGNGWRILRLPDEMGLHDAAMHRFGQWWKRMIRGGHAYAQGMAMHGRAPERFNVRPVRSAILWGALLPLLLLLSIALAPWQPALLLSVPLLLALPAALVFRVARSRRRAGDPWRRAMLYAAFIPLAKVAQSIGIATFWLGRLRGSAPRIIEYKGLPNRSSRSTARPAVEHRC